MQPSDSLPPSAAAPVPLASGLPRCRRLFCALWPTTRAPATCRASETGHRLSAKPGYVEERRGPPRLWDRPLRTCHGRTPRRIHPPPRPKDVSAGRCCGLRVKQDPRHPGRLEVSGPHALGPHVRLPTLRPSHLWNRRQAGYRLSRAHLWPDGIRTRWTMNKVSRRHRILPFPLTRRAWSH